MQKDRWEKEYRELQNIPSSRTMKPSRALKWFLENYAQEPGTALDIGCGKARNAIYLAEKGYAVTGIDISEVALIEGGKEVESANLTQKIKLFPHNSGEKMPFDDESFDLIFDMMTMHLLDGKERKIYASEVQRLLKSQGYFLFYTIDADSPAAIELFKKHPGPEKHSYVIPQSGMIEKAFTKTDIAEMFPLLKLLHLESQTQFTPAFGVVYERVYLLGLLVK